MPSHDAPVQASPEAVTAAAPSADADERPRPDVRVGEALRWAARFFHHRLLGSEEARAYLEGRAVSVGTARSFGLGYAPESWDALLSAGRRAGFDAEVLCAAGLARRWSSGEGFYDTFRHRLIFPFVAGRGDVIGFAGRTLDVAGSEEGALPKYLNTRTTNLFRKRELLYGHVGAARAIKEAGCALVVEGYMDAVTLHQAGLPNVVGTGGAGLTREQALRLALLTGHVTLLYDGDAAGIEAAERAADALLALGAGVRIGQLPIGLDPDALVRRHGAGFLRDRVLARAPSVVAYTLERGSGGGPAASRIEALSAVVRRLATCPAGPVREGYLAEMVSKTGLPPGTIRSSIALLQSAAPGEDGSRVAL